MRNIYPKLITTLFLLLLTAVIIRYAGANDQSQKANSKTAHLDNK